MPCNSNTPDFRAKHMTVWDVWATCNTWCSILGHPVHSLGIRDHLVHMYKCYWYLLLAWSRSRNFTRQKEVVYHQPNATTSLMVCPLPALKNIHIDFYKTLAEWSINKGASVLKKKRTTNNCLGVYCEKQKYMKNKNGCLRKFNCGP